MMDRTAVQNQLLLMRPFVSEAQTNLLSKLRVQNGDIEHTEQKILSLEKKKVDKISRLILLNGKDHTADSGTLDEFYIQISNDPAVLQSVEKFCDKFPNWKEELPLILPQINLKMLKTKDANCVGKDAEKSCSPQKQKQKTKRNKVTSVEESPLQFDGKCTAIESNGKDVHDQDNIDVPETNGNVECPHPKNKNKRKKQFEEESYPLKTMKHEDVDPQSCSSSVTSNSNTDEDDKAEHEKKQGKGNLKRDDHTNGIQKANKMHDLTQNHRDTDEFLDIKGSESTSHHYGQNRGWNRRGRPGRFGERRFNGRGGRGGRTRDGDRGSDCRPQGFSMNRSSCNYERLGKRRTPTDDVSGGSLLMPDYIKNPEEAKKAQEMFAKQKIGNRFETFRDRDRFEKQKRNGAVAEFQGKKITFGN